MNTRSRAGASQACGAQAERLQRGPGRAKLDQPAGRLNDSDEQGRPRPAHDAAAVDGLWPVAPQNAPVAGAHRLSGGERRGSDKPAAPAFKDKPADQEGGRERRASRDGLFTFGRFGSQDRTTSADNLAKTAGMSGQVYKR